MAAEYGNTGLGCADVLEAGKELAIDAMKFRPRNIAGLRSDQLRVIIDASLTAEEAGGQGAVDIYSTLGATRLIEEMGNVK